jgi:hypothetical protein
MQAGLESVNTASLEPTPDLDFDPDDLKLASIDNDDSDSDGGEEVSPWDDLDNEETLKRFVDIAFNCGDGEEWIPDTMHSKRKKCQYKPLQFQLH